MSHSHRSESQELFFAISTIFRRYVAWYGSFAGSQRVHLTQWDQNTEFNSINFINTHIESQAWNTGFKIPLRYSIRDFLLSTRLSYATCTLVPWDAGSLCTVCRTFNKNKIPFVYSKKIFRARTIFFINRFSIARVHWSSCDFDPASDPSPRFY